MMVRRLCASASPSARLSVLLPENFSAQSENSWRTGKNCGDATVALPAGDGFVCDTAAAMDGGVAGLGGVTRAKAAGGTTGGGSFLADFHGRETAAASTRRARSVA